MNTGHVGLNVQDLDRSVEFYTRVFDLGILKKGAEGGKEFALLSNNGRLAITLWQQGTQEFSSIHSGLHHLAFMVPSLKEVEEAERKLRSMNTSFEYDGIVPHSSGAESGGIFFFDPDGVRLEIYTEQGVTGEAPHCDSPSCGFF
ncbi:MAG: VOC family protein [Candidatus Obscuribacterales bacterium]|nr:VOC family protein [Candidatus Obscuribacterales bacterium]